jgi:DNA-binding NarL/FixJ family response regulator
VAALRRQLGPAACAALWAVGRAMSPKQALAAAGPAAEPAYPLAAPETPTESPQQPALRPGYPAGLSEREVDVLRLLAQGLSYGEIAETLVISPRTVNRHLTSIYHKLHVTSRHAAARFAVDHHLV